MVWNFCISTQLSEIVKESAISCNYFFPHPIPHKSIKLKKFSKNVWKKFLLYETVNSNCNLMIATQQKHHSFCIHCTAKYKMTFFFQELFVPSQNERFLGFCCYFVLCCFVSKYTADIPLSSLCGYWYLSFLIPVGEPVTNGHHLFIGSLLAMLVGGKLWPEY